MATDYENFAYSYAHAIIELNGVQFTAVRQVTHNQSNEKEPVYGTSFKPIKQSAGRVGFGEGNIYFSDLDEAAQFFATLGDEPFLKVFAIVITFANPNGDTYSEELLGCTLAGWGGDYESGAGAMEKEVPFTFLSMKVDGKELVR